MKLQNKVVGEYARPTKHFQGATAHPELFDLVKNKIISGEDAFLLLLIDSYVNWKGEGCYASTEVLAEDAGKEPRQIRNQIKLLRGYRLKKDKSSKKPKTRKQQGERWEYVGPRLLRIVGWIPRTDGGWMRVLETRWSRVTLDQQWEEGDVPPPGKQLPDPPGKQLPDPPGKELPPIYNDNTNATTKSEERVPPTEQNNTNSEQIHTSNGYSNGTHHHSGNGYHLNGTTPHLNGNGNSSRSNGTLFPKTKSKRSSSSRVNETGKLLKPKAKYSDFCYQLQDKFRELLRKYDHKPTDWTREKGAKSIHDLLAALDGDEERISEVIRWYPRNADVIERPKDVFSIHTLCGLKDGEPRMFLWLESLMKDDRYEWIKRTSRVVEFGHKYNEEGNCSYRTRTEYED